MNHKLRNRIFHNCRVYTLDSRKPRAEAFAVCGDKIIAIGAVEHEKELSGPDAELIDLQGKTVIPGLTDAHNHIVYYGLAVTRSADLTGTDSIQSLLEKLRHYREEHEDTLWILGRRFDQERLSDGRWPTREDLDSVSPYVPILITRICLHAAVANSSALALIKSGLSEEQRRTGILTEDAAQAAWKCIPAPTKAELKNAIIWALSEARRVGLSSVHCVISSYKELDALIELADAGNLAVRVRAMLPVNMLDRLASKKFTFNSTHGLLTIGPSKIFMDGSFGAHTAALSQPYSDCPDTRGRLLYNERDLANILSDIQHLGYQAAIHAIGDLAIDCALRGIDIAQANGNKNNVLRHRIEHAAQMSEQLVGEMARLKVPAVVQPQFLISDFWTRDRVGAERYRWSYPFRTMINAGITLAMGSDCPVERLDPAELIFRAMTRDEYSKDERLTIEDTLRTYALGGAYAGFEENVRGTLEVGKFADYVVLSDDPFEAVPEDLSNIHVIESAVAGTTR